MECMECKEGKHYTERRCWNGQFSTSCAFLSTCEGSTGYQRVNNPTPKGEGWIDTEDERDSVRYRQTPVGPRRSRDAFGRNV